MHTNDEAVGQNAMNIKTEKKTQMFFYIHYEFKRVKTCQI